MLNFINANNLRPLNTESCIFLMPVNKDNNLMPVKYRINVNNLRPGIRKVSNGKLSEKILY